MLKCQFDIVQNNSEYILLEDKCEIYNTMSLTNDVENLVVSLYDNNLLNKNKKLFYIDTEGQVDEILHTDEQFTTFRFGYENLEKFYKGMK